MERDNPSIQPLPRFAPQLEEEAGRAWRQSVRARLFALTFGITLALGVGWTLLQPAIYRSSATILMSAPSAIDATVEETDVQSVSIQRKILLGGEVTQRLLDDLDEIDFADLNLHKLKKVLQVDAVPDTNLVEMVAQGADAEMLPTLVNAWIDVYLDIRAKEVQRSQDQTLETVQDQLTVLSQKLEQAREALAAYRSENQITSVERQQNEQLARLEGLNLGLNNAIEAESADRAALESQRQALAGGKAVVSQSGNRNIQLIEAELRQLRARWANLTKNYTESFLNQPRSKELKARIAMLEEALIRLTAEDQKLTYEKTEQRHAAALLKVEDLQQKLEVQKEEAARFTTIYATHQALSEDLKELETLNRETQSRLVQVQVNQAEKYPQVSVVDRPAPEAERVGPDYLLLLGASLAAAFGLGVLSVWLYGFLAPRQTKPTFVTLSGVHMYPQEVSGQLTYSTQAENRIAQSETPLLPGDDPPGPVDEPDDHPRDRNKAT